MLQNLPCLVLLITKIICDKQEKAENIEFLGKMRIFGLHLVRFGMVRFGKKISGSVRFGGSVKILVRSYTILEILLLLVVVIV